MFSSLTEAGRRICTTCCPWTRTALPSVPPSWQVCNFALRRSPQGLSGPAWSRLYCHSDRALRNHLAPSIAEVEDNGLLRPSLAQTPIPVPLLVSCHPGAGPPACRLSVVVPEHAAGAVAAGAAAGRDASDGRHGAVAGPARGRRNRDRGPVRSAGSRAPSAGVYSVAGSNFRLAAPRREHHLIVSDVAVAACMVVTAEVCGVRAAHCQSDLFGPKSCITMQCPAAILRVALQAVFRRTCRSPS